MTTLAEHIIVARAENYPPMIEKSMYDSWVHRTRLFIKGKKHVYASPIHHQQHHTPVNLLQQSISPQPFIPPLRTQQSKAKFPQLGSDLAVLTFQQGEYPIDCINKAMTFLSVVASRVTVQQVQGRQTQSFADTRNKEISITSRGNYTMLAKAQEAGQILEEEQLAFLADPGMDEALVAQQIIPQNLAFQSEDLDAYDSDCDDISLAKAILMANISKDDVYRTNTP
nr:hypothetical protein [Tanacetum cinerariifolium]